MVFWIIWFVMGIAVILLFAGLVIPRIMLRTHAATLPVRDKAVGRLPDGEGTALRYAPADSVRPYIGSYTIAKDEKGMYFRGEWEKVLAFAEYELTVYNEENKIIDIFRIKEKFNSEKYTHITRLPEGTDYVTLRLICVDDTPIPADPQPFRKTYAFWLAALCFCFAVSVDFLLWLAGTFFLNCLDNFTMTYHLSVGTWAAILGLTALVVIAATCAFSVGNFFLRRKGYLHEKT